MSTWRMMAWNPNDDYSKGHCARFQPQIIYCFLVQQFPEINIVPLQTMNLLATLLLFDPGKCRCDFERPNFKHNLGIDTPTLPGMNSSFCILCTPTILHLTTWCRQATNHYPNQCWSWYMTFYVIARQQWVNCVQVKRILNVDFNKCFH